ncbi:hypothetical protein [Euzebya pacifica]|jgi:PHD/YefM family antitoxin component YafN of YafNO toxin-antitoxin module|uniref:hypothetical protein n=1 Tax=Euzebya pacifica TaxID=1608957 RepID=UPI0030F56658
MALHPIPTTEARRDLNRTLKRFRTEGPTAEPVLLGAHRRPEAIILPYEAYELLREVIEDVAIAGQVRERDREDDGTRMSVDDLAEELGIDLDE